MIDVEGVTRRFGDFTAVAKVDFKIAAGEIVGLLGHNGAGKTTLMKMITGYLAPSAGTIRVDGVSVSEDPRHAQARIGYLPENCPLYPEMTVVEYLDFQAGLHGVPAGKRRAALRRAIRLTELEAKALAPIRTLSRGYRQRVGVAQAILHEPRILILDEPTNGLDPNQILHMRRLIRDLAREATVIVSTHILQEVEAVCERVIILNAGRKVVDARLDELRRSRGLELVVDRPPEALTPVLAGLDGVGEVKLLDATEGRYRYRLDAAPDLAPAVAGAVQQAGFALHGLCPERRDLESLFAEVTRGGEVRDVA